MHCRKDLDLAFSADNLNHYLQFYMLFHVPLFADLPYLQERDSYWKMMQKYIGSDVTSMVTLPVIIFEPMTMLQKMAEVCAVCCCSLMHVQLCLCFNYV